MGRDTEIKIKYGMRGLPMDIDGLLSKADDTDLKILCAIFMLANEDGIVQMKDIVSLDSIDKEDVSGAIKFWKGAGVLESGNISGKKLNASEGKKEIGKTDVGTAHRDGAIEKSANLDTYLE